MVVRSLAEVSFALGDLAPLPRSTQALMTTPTHFNVEYVINPHMAGHIGTVDTAAAMRQWKGVEDAYSAIGIEVHSIEGAAGLPDMVFCANQTLPFIRQSSDRRGVVLSIMHAEQRKDEVASYRSFFSSIGYEIVELPDDITDFEGMGDAIWHPGRRLLWGGFGFRSDVRAYDFLSTELDVNVIALQLEDPDFYHLDTCLSVLDEETALIYGGAFTPDGVELLSHFFENLIDVPENEARKLFAANAHCPDGTHVIIQEGCEETNELLADAGFLPIQVDTSEFLKAGGSVFCMKQMFW